MAGLALRALWALWPLAALEGAETSQADAACEDEESTRLSFLQTKVQTSLREGFRETGYWASGRGNFPDYAVSNYSAPFHLQETFAWEWHHPQGRFATLTYGTAIDGQRNIYLSGADGLRKMDENGVMLWEYNSLPAEVMNAPALFDGKVFGSDTHGHVFALDMASGQKVWKTSVASEIGQDNGFVMAHDGVVVVACNWTRPSPNDEANQKVKALNSSDGEELWTYEPDTAVWNFLPLFVDRDMVFQDMTGKVYRLKLRTGELLWKSGGMNGSWTDGSAGLGANGLVYAVNNNIEQSYYRGDEFGPGTLSAYNVSNGQLVWKVTTPRPPNNAPAVGAVKNLPGLSVVMPLCQQISTGATCDVHVYDAETGGLRWVFHGPTQRGLLQAGDIEGVVARLARGVRLVCLPNGWSAPSIDAEGTVFVGNEEGNFYALRDENGDGVISGPEEVSAYDTKAAFSGSSTPAMAPGLLAVASCDSLFVFKSPA